MPEITSFTSFKIYVKNIRCQLKNVQDEIHNFKNMGWGAVYQEQKLFQTPAWWLSLPFDSHPFLEGRADGGQDGASPGYYPWRLQGPALPPSRLQNRKQEQTAACWGAPLLHAELNCLCISGRADTGLVNVRDRPQALVERGNRPQARARVSANKGGPGPLSLAHSTPSPEGRLRFHKGMVYFSDSTDVSEW